MNAELPNISTQKRLPFRPHPEEVDALYRALNKHIFNNALTQPDIILGTLKKCWGRCNWLETKQKRGQPGTYCRIELYDKWFCPQWFCTTLAHEMVHQWQWDIYRWDHIREFGREMYWDSGAHGPSFHHWRPDMAEWGISLKIAHGQKRWFRHQDLFKC
jgi:hypothetical protein